jgi:alkanesulfonate monooxygenase SsuD/methylene tetrahydromethanopterin reductase-like flavin-dependent oxidoreductase (luciferase family)
VKVGFVLPLAMGPGQEHGYDEIRRLALEGEAAGFDSVWVFDHLMHKPADGRAIGQWEAWTIQSAVAEATSRIELGQLVMCTAFRNPSLMAKMAATLDEISGGRLTLGLGCGWHEPEFEAYGFPFDHRVSRFEESLAITSGLLRDARADLRGRYETARDAELLLPQPHPNGPPILVAAKQQRMLRLTARHADAWNTAWFAHPDERFRERLDGLLAACAAEDRDPASLTQTVGIAVRYPSEEARATEPRDPARELGDSPEEVAEALAEFAELGMAHAMCTDPQTPGDLEWLTEALGLYRKARPVTAAAG